MIKLTIVAGARPNFMKIAPLIEAIHSAQKQGKVISYRLVHTGQHFDQNMSESFFQQLGIPHPDANLECGGGTQAEQTANIMVRFEQELLINPTDLVIVVGDVTSTMACAIVAKKLGIKVAHVEAGIRSGDISMPEEINRIVTDSITDYFFTTTQVANEKLKAIGVHQKSIFFVGNTMIDTLLKQLPQLMQPAIWKKAGLTGGNYFVITLHRPANVDAEQNLATLLTEIMEHTRGMDVVFPVHPRTAKNLAKLDVAYPKLHLVEPLSYLEFNYLVKNAKAVITDSGGITEETTVMGIPCMTLRNSTERPETCTVGTNELLGTNPKALKPALDILFRGDWKKGTIPEKWDGKAGKRIVDSLLTIFKQE